MSKARDLANLLGGGTSGAITFGGTAAIRVPNGTTEQRPTPAAGMIRYNTTTGFAEVYDGNQWAEFGAPPPSISTVTPSTYNGESGTTFTINGANFTSDATVYFVTSGGTEVQAGSVSFVSAAQLTATTPQDFTVADEPLDVKVVQNSGNVSKLDVIDCGGVPSWSTSSGTIIDTVQQKNVSTTLVATDPDAGSVVSYAVDSGSLPNGVSLNSSTGVISGTLPSVQNDTTYNFVASANDSAGNSTARSFGIIVRYAQVLNINSTNYTLDVARSFSSQGYYLLTPSTTSEVRIQLWGAGGGGGGGSSAPSRGGAGGYVEGVIQLLANTNYVFLIGQGGRSATNPTGRSFPDGGSSANNDGYLQAGGGGSSRFGVYTQSGFDLTNSSTNYNNTSAVYLLIAGAGGGGSDYMNSGTLAGFGGGLTGADGGGYYDQGESLASTGKGGTQSSGGAAGTTPARLAQTANADGAKYYGGNGSGGAGGGGYFGGGGARGYYSMGGGGSGFINPTGVSSGLFYTASAGQNHYITPDPRSNRPSSTTGFGGVSGGSGSNGYDGAIIITPL